MVKDIAIYGAGGLGKEVACLIDRINQYAPEPKWNLIGFFDDDKTKGTAISHFGYVLGDITELNAWSTPLAITIAIANPRILHIVHDRIQNALVEYPNLIDRSFYVVDPKTLQIGQGNIIQGPGSVSCDVILGNFNILNGNVVVGHDAIIGNYNVIMPGARVSGEVNMGNNNLLGIQSVVLQQIQLGDNVTLGAGSVLMTPPKNNSSYIGIPAKIFKY